MAAVQSGDAGVLDGVLRRQREHLLRELHGLAATRSGQLSAVEELLVTAAELHVRADIGVVNAAEQSLSVQPASAQPGPAAEPKAESPRRARSG